MNLIYDFGSWTRKSENLWYNAPFFNLWVAYLWQVVTVGWLWRKVSEIPTHINIKRAEFKQITKSRQTSGVFHLLFTYIFKSGNIFQEKYFTMAAYETSTFSRFTQHTHYLRNMFITNRNLYTIYLVNSSAEEGGREGGESRYKLAGPDYVAFVSRLCLSR